MINKNKTFISARIHLGYGETKASIVLLWLWFQKCLTSFLSALSTLNSTLGLSSYHQKAHCAIVYRKSDKTNDTHSLVHLGMSDDIKSYSLTWHPGGDGRFAKARLPELKHPPTLWQMGRCFNKQPDIAKAGVI